MYQGSVSDYCHLQSSWTPLELGVQLLRKRGRRPGFQLETEARNQARLNQGYDSLENR